MWWDTPRIEATVTRQFVCSHLIPEEVDRLDRPLGFGDGLTDGTYWEWIEKAKRIFLILADLGIPDQIFGIIDDSWDDDDLPIALDQVARLSLTPGRDDRLAKKFYARQFHYLVRYIDKGEHVIYQDDDLVPVVVDKRPGLATTTTVDRVELPNRAGEGFLRRRFSIGTNPGNVPMDNLLIEINSIKIALVNDARPMEIASKTGAEEADDELDALPGGHTLLYPPATSVSRQHQAVDDPISF
ncbi:hypothetical protein NPX13_g6173 [Xylaria arbuscula]|uniref:Uncharacterized protein n=1 Tax=Xylaria arbuscula TaxID=114810 RepID=A0A9W8NCQ6_9PEZI|nr:hypothetical protein NPX13_g6173 [Xylaria arbuscula]